MWLYLYVEKCDDVGLTLNDDILIDGVCFFLK